MKVIGIVFVLLQAIAVNDAYAYAFIWQNSCCYASTINAVDAIQKSSSRNSVQLQCSSLGLQDVSANKTAARPIVESGNITATILSTLDPLLDINLLIKTLEQWSKPLPPQYLSRPLILAGPSGVGKGRLIKALLKDYSKFFTKLTTYTTRKPRFDETPDISYHFVSNETFHGMVNNSEFMEWNKVHDNYYGISLSSWQEAQSNNKICIMEIDVKGAVSIQKDSKMYGIRVKTIFVSPPDIAVLEKRLVERGTETAEQVALRVNTAKNELEFVKTEGILQYVLILHA